MLIWNKKSQEEFLCLSYDEHRSNLGDILSPVIASIVSSKKVKRVSKRQTRKKEHYFMIGSILQRCTRHSTIWGSGFISADSVCAEIPAKVLAVRGPLTRDKLLSMNIPCPEVYGDPALLLPEIHTKPNKQAQFELGIIPHYLDKKEDWLKQEFLKDRRIKIIDIQNKNAEQAIDEILDCQKIISSSLHGLIIPDAYGIPSLWIEFSKPLEGSGFKFQDYFASVNRLQEKPVAIEHYNSLESILDVFKPYQITIDLKKLKDSFE
jgi:pyruvyltransferase